MAGGLPEPVRRLIRDHIESVSQLEVLLLLHAGPDDAWTGADAARRLHQTPEVTEATLGRLARGGLATVEVNDEGAPCFRFGPGSPALKSAVDELARKYATHKTSVIAAIFSSPSDTIQDFADAFRLRGDD